MDGGLGFGFIWLSKASKLFTNKSTDVSPYDLRDGYRRKEMPTSYLDGITTKLECKVKPGPGLLVVLKCGELQGELVNVQETAIPLTLCNEKCMTVS